MKAHFHQYPCGGFNIELVPENLKDAANLAFFNRNADAKARAVASVFVDVPKQTSDNPLTLHINLNTKPEKQRTCKL